MENFWNSRYSKQEYAYGIKPNDFFAKQLKQLTPGKLLLPAEGEGRNAVFAAKLGWDVTAFDTSSMGKKKAIQLAEKNAVNIKYEICSFDQFESSLDYFDCIALIYAHITDGNRQKYHRKLIQYLKSTGVFILEAFSKEQISNQSGGPKNIEFLYSKDELEVDFNMLKVDINLLETNLSEGTSHNGKANIIQVTGTMI